MRIEAHNRYNNPAHIILDRSRNHPNKLFMSTPNIIEMTPEHVDQFIAGLQAKAKEIWPNHNN